MKLALFDRDRLGLVSAGERTILDVTELVPWYDADPLSGWWRRLCPDFAENISSGTALSGSPRRIHYVASKGGVISFTRTREVGGAGISVNATAPGNTLSEEAPTPEILAIRRARVADRAIPRMQLPEDIVGAVVLFASPESDFITGQTLVVDGGAVLH